MIKWFKSRWSMKPTGKSFYDSIGGDEVRYWVDCYDVEWMGVSRWGFRVKTKE
jgi:hypothetical protein